VIDAARTLFLERGYVATTIEAISEQSDVPTATVYRLFSSKLGILKALLDTSIAGDDQPRAVQERPDVASLFTEPDPNKLLAGFARSLARARALKPGLRERDAGDLIHALMSPELHRLLVRDRGWTPERYQQWLATTLLQQLIEPSN